MDGLTLFFLARAAGFTIRAEGGSLKIRGPVHAQGIARQLIAHKQAVMDTLDLWSERAAIRQHDGGLSVADAEPAAWEDVLQLAGSGHGNSTPQDTGKNPIPLPLPHGIDGFTIDGRRYMAQRWRVESPADAVYFIDGSAERLTCSCPGFRFRGSCRHTAALCSVLGGKRCSA
jgi:hypothetical protein